MRETREQLPFTSRMTRTEAFAALVYLPIHIWLLPLLVDRLLGGQYSAAELNFICYAAGVLYIMVCLWHFLRREFDSLCDNLLFIALEIAICYGMMLACNLILNGVMAAIGSLISGGDGADFIAGNPNNAAVVDMSAADMGMTSALAVFLAPILEEPIFRGGIFGVLRRRSRLLAYLVSSLLFSVYHVWSYALLDPLAWLYLLQYLPVSFLLCRCYERSNSMWASIFLHMLINFISLRMLSMLQELM